MAPWAIDDPSRHRPAKEPNVSQPFFTEVEQRVPFASAGSSDPLAYKAYDPEIGRAHV